MLSLETARKLKEAGLKWEPQIYDFFYSYIGIENVDTLSFDDGKIDRVNHWNWNGKEYHLHGLYWIPRLDQLLAEIEKRGWEIDLQFFNNGTGWFCEVAKTVQFRHNKPRPKLTINNKDGTTSEVEPLNTCPGWGDYGEKRMNKEFTADYPEESAAAALLWILEQEVTA